MCCDCGQGCCQHRDTRDLPEAHLKLFFKAGHWPTGLQKDAKRLILTTVLSPATVIYKPRFLLTMDFTKRIFTFIFLWLIFSCVLLDHSQGFEVRLSKRARRSKHKPRKTKRNHHHYVRQMADLFSRLVVCMKGEKCFVSCLFFVLLYFFLQFS